MPDVDITAAAPPTVAILAGGTAGHIYPALALADAYRQRQAGIRLLFIGAAHGFEAELTRAHGERLALVDGAPLFGVGPLRKAEALWRLARGFRQARRLLRAEHVRLVIGFGGYVSAGTLLAARSLGLRTAIHEANAAPGLTNRLIARVVDRVFLGFDAARPRFPAVRSVVTGTPVRREFFLVGAAKERARPKRERHVLVTGGSLGSAFLNRLVPPLLRQLADHRPRLIVRHQTGHGSTDAVRSAYLSAGIPGEVVPYINDMPAAYAWADIAITCAGAITLGELAAAGLPALLVPLAAASEDHQRPNAQAFADATGVPWVAEADWRPATVAARLRPLLDDPEIWLATVRRLRALANPDAAGRLAAECDALLDSFPPAARLRRRGSQPRISPSRPRDGLR